MATGTLSGPLLHATGSPLAMIPSEGGGGSPQPAGRDPLVWREVWVELRRGLIFLKAREGDALSEVVLALKDFVVFTHSPQEMNASAFGQLPEPHGSELPMFQLSRVPLLAGPAHFFAVPTGAAANRSVWVSMLRLSANAAQGVLRSDEAPDRSRLFQPRTSLPAASGGAASAPAGSGAPGAAAALPLGGEGGGGIGGRYQPRGSAGPAGTADVGIADDHLEKRQQATETYDYSRHRLGALVPPDLLRANSGTVVTRERPATSAAADLAEEDMTETRRRAIRQKQRFASTVMFTPPPGPSSAAAAASAASGAGQGAGGHAGGHPYFPGFGELPRRFSDSEVLTLKAEQARFARAQAERKFRAREEDAWPVSAAAAGAVIFPEQHWRGSAEPVSSFGMVSSSSSVAAGVASASSVTSLPSVSASASASASGPEAGVGAVGPRPQAAPPSGTAAPGAGRPGDANTAGASSSSAASAAAGPLGARQHDVRVWVGSWNMGARDFEPRQYRELEKMVPSGYDIYVFGVQEGVGDGLFEQLGRVLLSSRVKRLQNADCRVYGRGDGSFMYPKYTGLAVYATDTIRSRVRVLRTASVDLGLTEGSKGGAAAALRVFDQTVVFVTAHLSAKSPEERRVGYRTLVDMVGSQLGDPHFQLLEQFHHVVFFGDLNYRIRGTTPEHVLHLIRSGNLQELRDPAHEELMAEMRHGRAFSLFSEPRPAFDFMPTYKKKEKRRLPVDYSDNNWVVGVYKTLYQEPWYKSGKVKERVPSFCDRVLFHTEGSLRPEETTDPHLGTHDRYYAVNDLLNGSDHSPVHAGFLLRATDTHVPRNMRDQQRDYRVRLAKLSMASGGEAPMHVRILFPGPFEDGYDGPQSTLVLGADIGRATSELGWICRELVRQLHLVLRVKVPDGRSGQCVVALPVEAFHEMRTLPISERLSHHGMPMRDRVTGRPVLVRFTLELSCKSAAAAAAAAAAVASASASAPLGGPGSATTSAAATGTRAPSTHPSSLNSNSSSVSGSPLAPSPPAGLSFAAEAAFRDC